MRSPFNYGLQRGLQWNGTEAAKSPVTLAPYFLSARVLNPPMVCKTRQRSHSAFCPTSVALNTTTWRQLCSRSLAYRSEYFAGS